MKLVKYMALMLVVSTLIFIEHDLERVADALQRMEANTKIVKVQR